MITDSSKKQKAEILAKKIAFQAAAVLFLIVVTILAIADFKIYQKKQELSSQIISYQKQIQDIKKSSQTLKDEIANSDNTDYLEKIAYEQLGEQKPGEKEVIFITPHKKPAEVLKPKNFWTSWLSQSWSWLKSKF